MTLPSRDVYFDRWSATHGGYDPRRSRFAGPWLSLSYVLARPLAARGIAPNAVTLAGVAASGAAVALALPGGRWALAAALAVVLSGLFDSLDGALALLRDRATPWGYVLDSAADRLSDVLYLLALRVLGAPTALCVLGGVLTFTLEYVRARAVGAGMTEIGVVTVWERATRVVVTVMFLLAAGLLGSPWPALGAAAWCGLGLLGCAQLLAVVRRRLR